jgi:hypothetical protein
MPYIDQENRQELDPAIDTLGRALRRQSLAGRDGAVNYAVTRLLLWAMCDLDRRWSYERIERAVGVLECAKLELYRRLAAPYEDRKIEANGDVY